MILTEYTLGQLDDVQGVPVRVDGGLVLIGPANGVCVACAEDARLAVLGPEAPRKNRGMKLGGMIAPVFKPLVDALIAQADDTVIAVRTDLGVVSRHKVRPRDGGCPKCAPLPQDSPELATVEDTPVLVERGELRSANEVTTVDNLRAELFDLRHGPVTGVYRTGHLPLAMMSAELVRDFATPEAGFGRTRDFAEAERVALFEAVERYNGMRPRRSSTVTEASHAELDHALDPVRLGLNDLDNGLAPYTPDLRMRWVHGWSYAENRPIAVPEQVAYWAVHTPPGQRFVLETSNGCGLGNSLTEAVLHGLFEVAERDAFLMAWYARTPLRQISVPKNDPVLPHLVDRLEELGYELLFLDATNDLGIPVVLTMARATEPDVPQAFFAAGANIDATKAMISAAAETVVDVESLVERARAKPDDYRPERLRRLFHQPELVRTMDDHVAVNALPEAAERHAFLVSDEDPADPATLSTPKQHTDLAALLDEYVRGFAREGHEVIAVDQSDPVIAERLGLYSAKVIVPGTVPMTFGHLNRRTRGLRRLLDVPHRLGRTGKVRYEDLALYPHPFP